MPYHGLDNNDYVNGSGFCCDDTTKTTKNKSLDPKGNDNPELYQYYYHSDHLGSSSYITNLDGEVAQHIEYVPFGEVFLEEKNDRWNTPYLFNGKELDEETGLYYYGARYYDSRLSLFLGVDPIADKYFSFTPYNYTLNNPLKFIDKNGKEPIKPLVGTIQSAIDFFRENNFNTVEDIDIFFATRRDMNGNIVENYTRYVYTENRGWIDLRHFFGANLRGEILDFVEITQCISNFSSCYSYEDLPSNDFGANTEFVIRNNKGETHELVGEELFTSIENAFVEAGATLPNKAPNYNKLPSKERAMLPRVKDISVTAMGSFPVYYSRKELNDLLKTGKYVPQNHSEKPYNLDNFPEPSEEFK